MVSAVVHGIFAGDDTKLSVKSCFSSLWELEQQYGSVIKGGIQSALQKQKSNDDDPLLSDTSASFRNSFKDTSVYTFQNGMQMVSDRIVEVLRGREGVRLCTNAPCRELAFSDVSIHFSNSVYSTTILILLY